MVKCDEKYGGFNFVKLIKYLKEIYKFWVRDIKIFSENVRVEEKYGISFGIF